MKKRFIVYGIVWAIATGLFNGIVFLVPHEINGIYRLNSTFWVSYAFVTAALVGQLLCGIIALKPSKKEAVLYRIPLIKISYGCVVATVIFASVFMAIPKIPSYVAAILCGIVLAFSVISLIKAEALAQIVGKVDEKQSERVAFMDSLKLKANNITNSAATEELKALGKRLCEEITYSDITSSDSLSEINKRLEAQLVAFGDDVQSGDYELAKENALAFSSLIKERNELCKSLK